jgi:uncharacterized SAM-binding protein YcdF (DUF218 family)
MDDYASLDALFVLGGEGLERNRCIRAVLVYGAIKLHRQAPLPIVLSGLHSVIYTGSQKVESVEMREYLAHRGIPREELFTEERSMNTVGNFFYSAPFFDFFEARNIGVITDDYQMRRALWVGERVLGPAYDLTPVSTGNRGTAARRLSEKISHTLLRLNMRNIRPGDRYAVREYLMKPHAVHIIGKQLSKSKVGTALLKRLRNS